MSNVNALRRASIEDFPGAPSWFEQFLNFQNDFNEDAYNKLNGGIGIDNSKMALVDVDLVHATETRVKNPLAKRRITVKGIYPVKCVGVEVGSNGQPTRTLYALGMPQVNWETANTADEQLLLTAYFPTDGQSTGYIGERISSFIASAAAVTLVASATAYDITSIPITPGDWDVGYNVILGIGSATGPTVTRSWINTASATDPGTAANADSRIVSGLVPTASGGVQQNIIGYRVSVSTTTTHYLGASMTFSGGSNASAYGRISAVRVSPSMTGKRGRVSLLFVGG